MDNIDKPLVSIFPKWGQYPGVIDQAGAEVCSKPVTQLKFFNTSLFYALLLHAMVVIIKTFSVLMKSC